MPTRSCVSRPAGTTAETQTQGKEGVDPMAMAMEMEMSMASLEESEMN